MNKTDNQSTKTMTKHQAMTSLKAYILKTQIGYRNADIKMTKDRQADIRIAFYQQPFDAMWDYFSNDKSLMTEVCGSYKVTESDFEEAYNFICDWFYNDNDMLTTDSWQLFDVLTVLIK